MGVLWSKASFSFAERSVTGARVRQFTVDEVVAFSAAFGLPVSWFLIPPSTPVRTFARGSVKGKTLTADALILALFWTDDVLEHLREVLPDLPDEVGGCDRSGVGEIRRNSAASRPRSCSDNDPEHRQQLAATCEGVGNAVVEQVIGAVETQPDQTVAPTLRTTRKTPKPRSLKN